MWSLGILRSFSTGNREEKNEEHSFRVNVFERETASRAKHEWKHCQEQCIAVIETKPQHGEYTQHSIAHPKMIQQENTTKNQKAEKHTHRTQLNSCRNLFNKNGSMFYSNEMWSDPIRFVVCKFLWSRSCFGFVSFFVLYSVFFFFLAWALNRISLISIEFACNFLKRLC